MTDGLDEVIAYAEPGDEQTALAVIDINESVQKPELLAKIKRHADVDDWIVHELDAADIVVNGVGFERKTPSDFASSMTEDRLNEQVIKLQQAYEHAYILLEGDFSDFDALRHGPTGTSLRGKAASVTAREGIPVIPCGDDDSLIDMAVRYARKHSEDRTSAYIKSSVVGSDEPAGKRMWGCLPNVGPELAGRLYEEFNGSPVDFAMQGMQYPIDRLTVVNGIGETTAEQMTEAMWTREW